MSTNINMKLYVQIFLRHCTSMLYCIYLVQLNIVLVALNVANNEYKTIGTGIESNKNISPVRDRTSDIFAPLLGAPYPTFSVPILPPI